MQAATAWFGRVPGDEALQIFGDAEHTAARLLEGSRELFNKAIQTLDAMHDEFKDLGELKKAAE